MLRNFKQSARTEKKKTRKKNARNFLEAAQDAFKENKDRSQFLAKQLLLIPVNNLKKNELKKKDNKPLQ